MLLFSRRLVSTATPLGAALVVAFILLTWPSQVYAATINVNGTTCKLPDAITAANTDAETGSCTAGSGADILLLAPITHLLTTTLSTDNDNTGTPAITSTMTISGGVAGATVERSGSAHYRLFYVGGNGDLTLEHVTLRNGRSDSNGGAIYNTQFLTLLDSTIFSNTATTNGGGIYNDFNSTLTLTGSTVVSNTATNQGGGIYNPTNSIAKLTNTQILSNTVLGANTLVGMGGGLYNQGTATLTNIQIFSNRATSYGGGLINFNTITLTNTQILSNTGFRGGGIYNNPGNTVTLSGSTVGSNKAVDSGGGLYNIGTVTLTNTQILSNTATNYAGGIFNYPNSIVTLTGSTVGFNKVTFYGGGIDNSGTVTLTDTHILSNTALHNGGGIFNEINGTVMLNGSTVVSNTANQGGGIYNTETLTVFASSLIGNVALDTGGALYQADGDASIAYSCMNNNSATAVAYVSGDPVDAAFNWWGAPDGPSGAAPGSGDSVSANVTFMPFFNDCPTNVFSISLAATSAPLGALLPGQPLTYTVTINNQGSDDIHNLHLSEQFPSGFVLNHVVASGLLADQGGNHYLLAHLLAGQSMSQQYVGTVSGALVAATVLTHTSTLTNTLLVPPVQASSSNAVIIPTLSWSAATYATSENSGNFSANVKLSPTNPYTTVTAEATITGQPTQNLTFPPNSGQQPVVVAVVNDHVKQADKVIQLGLQSPVRAKLGSPSHATLTIHDDDPLLALKVVKSANTNEAHVGDTITYTYLISNTGEAALTILAVDDKLGAVSALSSGGALAVNTARSASLSHLVSAGDLAHEPLVNTVVVTGTGNIDAHVVATDSASVHITPATANHLALVVDKRVNTNDATVGDMITYTYRITNTGNASLTIVATDDKLGAVSALSSGGSLAVKGTRTATLSHLVSAADLAAEPLVNTVTVIGTDNLNAHFTVSDTVSVHITPAEPGDEKPEIALSVSANRPDAQVGDTITFTYRITNTGSVTITSVNAQLQDTAQAASASPSSDLPPSVATTGSIAYVVLFTDWPGPLEKTVQVTVTANNGQSVSKSASITLSLRQGTVNLPSLSR